jgi:hypothetical protein
LITGSGSRNPDLALQPALDVQEARFDRVYAAEPPEDARQPVDQLLMDRGSGLVSRGDPLGEVSEFAIVL